MVNGVTAIARFPFTDVVAGTWYYGAAAYAYNNGLFAGMTPTTFAPNATMTRAMLVSVLWRLAGAPAPKAPNTFVDVPDGAWYTDAVTWAAENGVVSGIGGSRFDPSGFVTREQTAEILYNLSLIHILAVGMSGCAKIALTTATPTMPLPESRATLSFVMPPMAMTGMDTAAQISRRVS